MPPIETAAPATPVPPGSSLWPSTSQPPAPAMPSFNPPLLAKLPPHMPSTALSVPPPTAAGAALLSREQAQTPLMVVVCPPNVLPLQAQEIHVGL
ncbi:hypothetical protein C0989_007025 [Termitomyces sp. Mn162]|nr:hypothetical protein C0989_007025 [Termitomyces sp. Mn162]